MNKLIITLALTGNVPTKKMNPNVPISVTEICDEIEKCCELGVSVAHIHARDENGMPSHSRKIYKDILDEIKRRKIDVITQVSTGARGGENSIESRGQMLDLDCEMASLASGSSNFPTSVNANSPELISKLAEKMLRNNIKAEIEAFEIGMVNVVPFYARSGLLNEPFNFNLVMNVPGSIKGTLKNLMFMVDSLPANSNWTVSGIGRSQVPMISAAILLGGHVRTGLEDVLEYSPGKLATNVMLVERVIRIANELGREIATPSEAREILGIN